MKAVRGSSALRHQQESRLSLAASFSGPALGPPGLPGERNRRGGRNLLSAFVQGITASSETFEKTGRSGVEARALLRAGSGPDRSGPLGSDFRGDSSEGRPPGDRNRPETALGPGCRPLHRWRRKGFLRSGGPRNGDGSSGCQPEKGDSGAGPVSPISRM